MLISFFSVKGAPGTTSAALALAAVWPRDVVLVEADPSGGDLAYRCAAPGGAVLGETTGMLSLAADVRRKAGGVGPESHAQELANGVQLVQGMRATQAAGIGSGLWVGLAGALRAGAVDVIVDLGRVSPQAPHVPIACESDVLVPVGTASVESVMHTTSSLPSILASLAGGRRQRIRPLLLGDDRSAAHDCADHDLLLERAGVVDAATGSLPLDGSAQVRLERGERPDGRLGRTLLVRRARRLATHWAGRHDDDSAEPASAPGRSLAIASPGAAARWMVPRPEGAT